MAIGQDVLCVYYGRSIKTASVSVIITIILILDGPRLTSAEPQFSKDDISSAWYSGDGKVLYTVSRSRPALVRIGLAVESPRVKMWNAVTGDFISDIAGFKACSGALGGGGLKATTNPSGTILATYFTEVIPTHGAPRNTARLSLWNAPKNTLIGDLPLEWKSQIEEIIFSPDGRFVAIAGQNVCVYRTDTLELATCFAGNRTRKDDFEDKRGSQARTDSIKFSPDGTKLATAGRDGYVRFWSIPAFKELSALDCWPNNDQITSVTSIAFSPDGKILIAAVGDGRITCWETATGKLVRTLKHRPLPDPKNYIPQPRILVAISPSSPMLATLDHNRLIIWDINTGELLAKQELREAHSRSLCFNPKGDIVTITRADDPGVILQWSISQKPFQMTRK